MSQWWGVVWFGALAASSCAGAGDVSAPPEPVPAPRLLLEGASLAETHGEAFLLPPTGEPLVDEILASPMLRDPEFQEAVARWVDYWQSTAHDWFPDYLRRMGSFEQTVDSALAERGLPPSLRYLPLIESGYSPGARSRASAVGMWQFMSGTATELGMEVSAFLDERRNPYKSTAAAAAMLDDLHESFDSWFLALAAYNGGPNRARRILRQQAPLAQPSDSLFWALRRHWPPETRDFIPKLVGAVIVAGRPTEHGYADTERDPPLRFDEVRVPDATTFDVLARAAETDEEEIRRLNPELFRGFTPPGRGVVLRVPAGMASTFEANYAAIPTKERMTIVEHYIASGETLSHVARRYGVSVADLQAANPDVRPRYLRIGARITVPIMLARGGSG
jgi:membrane-bound lytic murein transglycosylase D